MGWSEQVERNLQAIECERRGDLQEAIELYEANITESFNGTHPYERLSELYLQSNQQDDLLRVLEKAINVFEGVELTDCQHKHTQLEQFKKMYINLTNNLGAVN